MPKIYPGSAQQTSSIPSSNLTLEHAYRFMKRPHLPVQRHDLFSTIRIPPPTFFRFSNLLGTKVPRYLGKVMPGRIPRKCEVCYLPGKKVRRYLGTASEYRVPRKCDVEDLLGTKVSRYLGNG